MTVFHTEYRGKTVRGVRLESLAGLDPYKAALNEREVKAVSDALAAGMKVEILDEPVAEIHVEDSMVLAGFPNPTRDDAPEAHGTICEPVKPGESLFSDDELRELGLDPRNRVAGVGGTIRSATRWSPLDDERLASRWWGFLRGWKARGNVSPATDSKTEKGST